MPPRVQMKPAYRWTKCACGCGRVSHDLFDDTGQLVAWYQRGCDGRFVWSTNTRCGTGTATTAALAKRAVEAAIEGRGR